MSISPVSILFHWTYRWNIVDVYTITYHSNNFCMYIEYYWMTIPIQLITSLIYPMDRVYNWYICVPDEFQTVYGIQSSYHNATTTRQNKEMRTKWCIWMADTVYIYWDIPRCSVYIHSSSATEYNNCPDVFSYYELPQTTTLYSVQTTNCPVNPKPTNMPLCSKTHAHCRFCTPYIHHHTRQQLPCNIAYNPCQDPFLPASFIHSFNDFLYVEIPSTTKPRTKHGDNKQSATTRVSV